MNPRYTPWPAAFFVLSAVLLLVVPVRAWSQIGAWIDPGHGDACEQRGAPGFNGDTPPDEKDLTLIVAGEVMNRLGGLGYTSALTRTFDHCVSVNVRPRIAAGLAPNDEGLTVEGVTFVSIHMDGDPDPSVRGTFRNLPVAKVALQNFR